MTTVNARVVVTTRPEHRDKAYDAIDGERAYQDDRFDGRKPLSVGETILVLDEYVMKAKLSWSQEKRPEAHTMGIIRKIAGIAVHAMEDHGSIPREGYENT